MRHRGRRNSALLPPPSSGSGSDSAVGMTSATQLVHHEDDYDDTTRINTSHVRHSQLSSPVSGPEYPEYPEYEYEYEDEEEEEFGDATSTLRYTKRSGDSSYDHHHHRHHHTTETPRPRRHSVTSSKLGGPAEHVTPTAATSNSSTRSKSSHHDNTLDIPLAVAIIPPLGSLLIGGNFAYDFLLLLLMFFYLHQLIKLPWELYLASRPRRVDRKSTVGPGSSDFAHDINIPPHLYDLYTLAESELKTAEFVYLGLSVLSPLIGAALLRYVCTALAGRDYISWFSTGVFVLVTGIRPWGHLTRRLRERTDELQETVVQVREYGASMKDGQEGMMSRIEALEDAIAKSKEAIEELKRKMDVSLQTAADPAFDTLASDVKQQLWTLNERVGMLENIAREGLGDMDSKNVAMGREKISGQRRLSLSSISQSEDRGSKYGQLGRMRSASHSHRADKTSWRSKLGAQLKSGKDQHRSVSTTLIPPKLKFSSVTPSRYVNYLSPSYWVKLVTEFVLESILNLVALCFGAGRRWVLAFGVFVRRCFA